MIGNGKVEKEGWEGGRRAATANLGELVQKGAATGVRDLSAAPGLFVLCLHCIRFRALPLAPLLRLEQRGRRAALEERELLQGGLVRRLPRLCHLPRARRLRTVFVAHKPRNCDKGCARFL